MLVRRIRRQGVRVPRVGAEVDATSGRMGMRAAEGVFQCDEQETAAQLPDGLKPVLVDSQALDFRIESPRWQT
jgi:hypothetical protein